MPKLKPETDATLAGDIARFSFDPDFKQPIQITTIHSVGLYVTWGQDTVGFGELALSCKDGVIRADTEGMSKEWTRRALYALADKIVEEAFDESGRAKP